MCWRKVREVWVAGAKLRDGERTDDARNIAEDRPYRAFGRCRKVIVLNRRVTGPDF